MAPSPASFTSPETLTFRSIEGYLEGLPIAPALSEPLFLDWEKLRRIEAPAASILSQALIGRLGNLPLVIRIPSDLDHLEAVFWSGVRFALANREGPTEVIPELLAEPQWRRSWVPGEVRAMRGLFQQHLFDPQEFGVKPDIFGRYHAAFINPHRLPAKAANQDIGSIVRPWLSDVLPNLRNSEVMAPARQHFLFEVTAVIDELLQNVREHARHTSVGSPTRSLVQISVTLGGGVESFNRIYISVQDAGPGIVTTARPKIRFSEGAEMSDADLLAHLFTGDLDPWNQGRGMGLPRVWRIVQARKNAGLWVASNKERLASSEGSLASIGAGFDIGGSVVVAMIPEPEIEEAN